MQETKWTVEDWEEVGRGFYADFNAGSYFGTLYAYPHDGKWSYEAGFEGTRYGEVGTADSIEEAKAGAEESAKKYGEQALGLSFS